jgi:TetR/AcrR family transcriptional regulator
MVHHAEDPKKKIIAAATAHFSAKGFFGARMQSIADEAGVNKAMLHYYFSTKRDLYVHVLAEVYREIFGGLAARVVPEADAKARLKLFIQFFLDFWSTRQSLMALVERELLDGGEALDEALNMVFGDAAFFGGLTGRALVENLVGLTWPRSLELTHTVFSVTGMCVVSFLGRPIFGKIMQEDVSDFDAYLARRRTNILTLIDRIFAAEPSAGGQGGGPGGVRS